MEKLNDELDKKINFFMANINEEMNTLIETAFNKFILDLQAKKQSLLNAFNLKIRKLVTESFEFGHKNNEILTKISSNKVLLDIGGYNFSTSLSTLTKFQNAKIALIFKDVDFQKGKEERFFIDRNGKYFEYVLDGLRNNQIILPNDEFLKTNVLEELKFYGLNGLIPFSNEDFHQMNLN